ncbi:class I SAM-dependent methyltransferase [Akkermansiaceae bacterium]|nr:class I SAM-dependent methyltransferase [Akkermansiaceae bacterium]
MRLLKKNLTNGKILEIGPGNGSFLGKAIKAGYDVDAVEYSKVLAQEMNKQLGLKIKSGKFEEQDFNDLKFDAYLSFHVIEHVPDVIAHMKKANDIIRNNGYAFIATPNVASWEQKISLGNSPNYCMSHLHLFTKESLSLCLKQTGWNVIHVSTPSYVSSWPRVITSFMRKYQNRNQSSPRSKSRKNYMISNNRKIFWAVKVFDLITKPFRLIQEALHGGNELFIVAQKTE